MRLTLLYGGLFLAAGIALLVITYGLTQTNVGFTITTSGSNQIITGTPQGDSTFGEVSGSAGGAAPGQNTQAFRQGVAASRDAVRTQLLVLSA
ncbi:MAG TPA: hypothetical protein VGM75_17935, partial [Pseudonocardiaceae bacterium]